MPVTLDPLARGRELATHHGTRARALHALERQRRMAQHEVYRSYAHRAEWLTEIDLGAESLQMMDGPPILPWDARKEAWFRALALQSVAAALEEVGLELVNLPGEASREIEGPWLTEVASALDAMGGKLPPKDWDRRE